MAYQPWTLEQAQQHLANWLQADAACATGQSYTIANRTLTRAHSAEIRKNIAFWRAECERLASGRSAGARVMRAVPVDL